MAWCCSAGGSVWWLWPCVEGVVLLEYIVLVTGETWRDVRFEDLVNVAESCEAISHAWVNILEDNRSNSLVKSDSAPNHDVWIVPWVSLHHTNVCVTFAPPSPDPDSVIRHGNAVATCICNDLRTLASLQTSKRLMSHFQIILSLLL